MKTTLDIFVVVDSCGDYEVGGSEEQAKERYTDNIGALEDSAGFRVLKLAVAVPLPAVISATAEIADEEPAELTAE